MISQNNNNGGYACERAVGNAAIQNEAGLFFYKTTTEAGTQKFNQSKKMYYYSGSVLPIEWTNQHGCGNNTKVNCEIIFQYACEDTLDPKVDDFWPWVQNKAQVGTTYRGTQHYRVGANIGAPRDGVPRDSNDAATDTIQANEAAAIASTTGKLLCQVCLCVFILTFSLRNPKIRYARELRLFQCECPD